MTELIIPDSVKESADVETFICINGTEEQRVFCTFLVAASAKIPLNAKQFLLICQRLREMIADGILIDQKAQPLIYGSPLQKELTAMENSDFTIDRPTLIAIACFYFGINENHTFIAELHGAMDSAWDELMMKTIFGSNVQIVDRV